MRFAAISSRWRVRTASTASGTIVPTATTWTTGLPGGSGSAASEASISR